MTRDPLNPDGQTTEWCCQVLDTEAREARGRSYTRSPGRAHRWNRIPPTPFSDSGHGLGFSVFPHRGPKRPVEDREGYRRYERRQAELERRRTAFNAVEMGWLHYALWQLHGSDDSFQHPEVEALLAKLDQDRVVEIPTRGDLP